MGKFGVLVEEPAGNMRVVQENIRPGSYKGLKYRLRVFPGSMRSALENDTELIQSS